MSMQTIVRTLAFGGMLASFAWPAVVERYEVLNKLFQNAPELMATRKHDFLPWKFDLQFTDRVKFCEDVILVEEQGFAILSCDPGRAAWNTVMGTFIDHKPAGALHLYQYATPGDEPKKINLLNFDDRENFHPLGIEYDAASQTLFVINHKSGAIEGSIETDISIEIFKLGHSNSQATHIRTLSDPEGLLRSPNSIHLVNSNELYITNDHRFPVAKYGKIVAQLETYLGPMVPWGPVSGFVTYYNLLTDESKMVARVPFANGISAGVKKDTIIVASSAMTCFFVYRIGEDHSLALEQTVKVPFFPDNLSLTTSSKLLVSGHPHPPTLEIYAKEIHDVNTAETLTKPWTWVQEWDGDNLKDVYIGDQIVSGTTAVRDEQNGVVLVIGLYGKGILVGRK